MLQDLSVGRSGRLGLRKGDKVGGGKGRGAKRARPTRHRQPRAPCPRPLIREAATTGFGRNVI